MNRAQTATRLFRDGCACSQAVLLAYAEPLGLPRKTALQIAAGFAGGMRMGSTCGAVTGALMVLGLRHPAEDCETAAGRAKLYAATADFVARFQARNGSTVCRELLGCDISTPAGMKQAQERNLFKTACPKLVEDAAAILDEVESAGTAAVAAGVPEVRPQTTRRVIS